MSFVFKWQSRSTFILITAVFMSACNPVDFGPTDEIGAIGQSSTPLPLPHLPDGHSIFLDIDVIEISSGGGSGVSDDGVIFAQASLGLVAVPIHSHTESIPSPLYNFDLGFWPMIKMHY